MFFDSFGLLGTLGLVALIVIVFRLNTRLKLVERELGALRSHVLSTPPAAMAPAVAEEQAPAAAIERIGEPAADGEVAAVEQDAGESAGPTGPWGTVEGRDAPTEAVPAAAVRPTAAKADIETALGTRWAVWVGGIALALGGVFLIRYSIEAGIFGPGVRLTMAALLGLALVGAGEFIRRTGFEIPLNGGNNAYIPGILTAAGAFTLFGAVYAAHGVYGFIGPALAFVLMGIIGVGAIAAALLHGQALAGFGLLGSLVTPLLVASEAPNAWALFGYLAIVLVATTAIARLRDWRLLAGAAFAGTGLWCLVYLAGSETIDFTVVLFINLVILLSLAFIWLAWRTGNEEAPVAFDWPTAIPALSVALAALSLLINPDHQASGGALYGAVLIAAMVAIALYRPGALALLHAAGAASVAAYARAALSGSFAFDFDGGSIVIKGLPSAPFSALMPYVGAAIGALFLATGLWSARNLPASAPVRGAHWAAWAAVAPLAILASVWIVSGNPDRDRGCCAVARRDPGRRRRGHRQGRKPAAHRPPIRFLRPGGSGRLLRPDAAHGVRARLDDGSCRRSRRAARTSDTAARLSRVGLAVRRRGDRRDGAHHGRSDDRRPGIPRQDPGVQRAPARLRHRGARVRFCRLAIGADHCRTATPGHGSGRRPVRASDDRNAGAPRDAWRRDRR
jgi:uncharacterized membrane protein